MRSINRYGDKRSDAFYFILWNLEDDIGLNYGKHKNSEGWEYFESSNKTNFKLELIL